MRIRDLTLKTDRMMDVSRFYHDIFGLPVVEEELGRISFQIGYTRLTFERVPENEHSPFYHFAINIPSNHFSQAKKWLADRTPLLNDSDGEDEFYFEAMDAQAVYFRDPGHNIGELIARDEIAESSSRNFGVEELLSISEVGLPVQDIRAAGALLEENFHLPVYIDMTDLFGVLGNPEGLFILVREGRPWVPSLAPAAIHPMRIGIEGASSRILELPGHPYRIEMKP